MHSIKDNNMIVTLICLYKISILILYNRSSTQSLAVHGGESLHYTITKSDSVKSMFATLSFLGERLMHQAVITRL